MHNLSREHRQELLTALQLVDLDAIEHASVMISDAISSGHKVLVCGNGGSAAQAQHFCAELECSYKIKDRKGYPALALHANTSSLTAFSNDFDFDRFFRRMVRVHGKPGDVLVAITTSGTSENVLSAIEAAQEMKIQVILLTGYRFDAGPTAPTLWIPVRGPGGTPRIQECHMFILHEIADLVEQLVERPLV